LRIWQSAMPRASWRRSLLEGMNRSCVYCGNAADTRDHVPPKLLYKKPYPENLPTVPCCSPCNGAWSSDEQYFKVALSFVGGSAYLDAMHDEGAFTDKTLSNSNAIWFDEAILNSMGVDEFDRPYFKPDINRLGRVLEKIALGLSELSGFKTAGVTFTTVCFDRVSELLVGLTTADYLVAALLQNQQIWKIGQADVFEHAIFRLANDLQPTAYCALRLYGSIVGIVLVDNLRNDNWNSLLNLVPNGAANTG
jgi:hypothetical protein